MVGTNLEARIRERAYQLWEGEGRPHGRHLEHWRRAEQEVESQAEQGILKTRTGDEPTAPRMSPASPAAAEAKRAVKRKQTQSEAKAPRTKRPKTPPKPKV